MLLEAPSAFSGVALIVSGAQDAGQLYEGWTLRITPSVCPPISPLIAACGENLLQNLCWLELVHVRSKRKQPRFLFCPIDTLFITSVQHLALRLVLRLYSSSTDPTICRPRVFCWLALRLDRTQRALRLLPRSLHHSLTSHQLAASVPLLCNLAWLILSLLVAVRLQAELLMLAYRRFAQLLPLLCWLDCHFSFNLGVR